jgi:hypothetical protein
VSPAREQQVLGRDVLVGEPFRLGRGGGQQARRRRREPHLGATEHLGEPVESLVRAIPHGLRRDTDLVQQRIHDPLGIGQQREEHVLGLDRLVVPRERLLMGALEGRAGLDGQLAGVHRSLPS